MDKWLKRSVELLTSLSFGKEADMSVVPYSPQKICISGDEDKFFKRTTPESHGISSKRIYNMLCELEWEKRANVHNLLVIKDGEVISECSADGYSTGVWHLSHSMSKTVTGMAVGMLVDDGRLRLGDRLVDIFPEIPYKDKRFSQITVEHLLSMQTGVPFAEAGSVTESDWTGAFFNSTLRSAPGSTFSYNSMNSYMLARIVSRLTGTSLIEFVRERLFSPLGIRNYFWEIGPEGIEKGGWGLFLSAESWAKIGWMLLSGGEFFGKRILSREWVEKSTTMHSKSLMIDGDFNYAYQMWVGRNTSEILFNGMLGQNVWICPKNNLVVVINSGNNEMFQLSPALDIIRKYLGCDIEDSLNKHDIRALEEREAHFFDSRRWVRPLEKKRGILYFLHLRSSVSFDDRWLEVCHRYRVQRNGSSMLPLFIAGMQNNFNAGISALSLERAGDSLLLGFREGGVDYSLEVGLYEYKSTVLDFRGEKYIVMAMGEALIGARGTKEYRVELVFPEMPNTRMIRIMPTGDGVVSIELSEVPNNEMVNKLIARVPHTNGAAGFALEILRRRFGDSFIEDKVRSVFTPTLLGVSEELSECEELIRREEARCSEETKLVKLLKAVVKRFFKETAEIAESGEEQSDGAPTEPDERKQGFLGSVLDKLKKKK